MCCPADELMSYVNKVNIQEVRNALQFQPRFVEHSDRIKKGVAEKMNSTLEDITFVGIHHRRTVRIGTFRLLVAAYSSLPNRRTCTPYLISAKLPPCTLLFGTASLSIFSLRVAA